MLTYPSMHPSAPPETVTFKVVSLRATGFLGELAA